MAQDTSFPTSVGFAAGRFAGSVVVRFHETKSSLKKYSDGLEISYPAGACD
jgi:hypothetical protein